MPPFVEYRVSLSARAEHLYDMEARFPVAHEMRGEGGSIELRLPVWTPGSYLIREYERHLQDLVCADEAGRPLAVRKVAKARWRVDAGAASEVRAHYRVYAHEVTVRTCHLDGSHAFMNGAPLFLYVDELRARGIRLRIEAPAGWHATTALPNDPGDPRDPGEVPDPIRPPIFAFRADDYDMLVDSPIELGTHELLEFSAAGRPTSIAIWGRATFDRRRLTDDVTAIIETQAGLFGGVPYEHYRFLLHLVPGGYGGLEHRSSATLLSSPHAFLSEKRYHEFLELVSHEFFHLWNGKRIRPSALGPFDYQNEVYTRSLWVVEGWTSYYDRYMLRRARRISATRFREKLGEDLTRIARIPGRAHTSLEDSSFDAWIKLYRPDENTANTTVSYYLKGSVAALLLDLEIRSRTEGRRSLDDALRLLWANFQRDGRGYTDGGLQLLVEEATGIGLEDFFERAVRARGNLDLDGALATVGLALKRSSGSDDKLDAGWLGANLLSQGERLRVTESLTGSPAQIGHLYPGDEIVAWDGYRVDDAGVKERLLAGRAGDRVRLTVFRRDELRELSIELGQRPLDKIEVVPLLSATAEARAAYERWMHEEWKAE